MTSLLPLLTGGHSIVAVPCTVILRGVAAGLLSFPSMGFAMAGARGTIVMTAISSQSGCSKEARHGQ